MKWKDLYIGYVNLAHREDRRTHMEAELSRVGLEAVRHEGINTKGSEWNRHPYEVMYKRTSGAIGCMLSQMEVMKAAYEHGKGAMVLEDDLVFATDIKERLDYIENFVNTKEPEADIIFLGGTVHLNPAWWHTKEHEPILRELCNCKLERDFDYIGDERMIRVYGMFSTHAYIIPYERIQFILSILEATMSYSIGIDFSLIVHQTKLDCFAYLPGSVKQIDNMSDIGNGMTIFSSFSMLGSHWFQDNMNDYKLQQ